MIAKEDCLTVDVRNLKYKSPKSYVSGTFIKKFLPIYYGEQLGRHTYLRNVSFTAHSGRLTYIFSPTCEERCTLLELIAGRRGYGTFNGDINFIGNTSRKSLRVLTAYVSREATQLYTPGLTYHDMLLFAARLRMRYSVQTSLEKSSRSREQEVQSRVADVLRIMNLWWCRDRLISERPTERGTLGGELRRLAIAIQLVNLPPVILLEEPTDGLDAAVSVELMSCLLQFAEGGCTIVVSLAKPSLPVFNFAHDVVLLSRGFRIYAGPKNKAVEFFCSEGVGYAIQEDGGPIDFIFDIADSTERPAGTRKALQSEDLLTRFETSIFCEPSAMLEDGAARACLCVLPVERVPYYGYFGQGGRGHVWSRTLTVIHRAFFVKIRERSVLLRSFKQAIVIGLLFGYFQFGMGNDSEYCTNILDFSYNEVACISSHMWLICTAAFAAAVTNIHIVYQKIQVFRYENAVGACPLPAFWFATLISEIPFSVLFSLIQASIIYSMAALNTGVSNYFFYVSAVCMVSVIGLTTAIMFAAVIQKELIVRDLFLFCSFMMTMSSGYLFKYDDMNEYVSQVSKINFMRWTYESLMVWKFKDYPDGKEFLASYDFDNFDHHRLWFIMMYFVLADVFFFFLGLLPSPNLLHRQKREENAENLLHCNGDGIDRDRSSSLDLDSRSSSSEMHFSERSADPAVPKVFLKQSSVSSASSYRVSTNVDGKQKGPTVTFKHLSMSVPDPTSPEGSKKILHNMNGQFDWGRLTVIMGSEGAGKSSLLHILAGELRTTSSATVHGLVQYDGKPIDLSVSGWRRCGFVEAQDLHYRDITVREVVYFAMKLRCNSRRALAMVEDNVKQALDLVQLAEFADCKTKNLSAGCLRRLSIAEEIVCGPTLVFVDEPTTSLNVRENSIIVTAVLRELVNQDRTVVVTMHQPSAAAFDVVDTLVLLSKGHMIYMGPADKALNFFVSSPSLNFSMKDYNNAADFLSDVSGCLLRNDQGAIVDSLTLANHYRDSSVFAAFASLLRVAGDKSNTLNSGLSVLEETSEASSEMEFATTLLPSPRGKGIRHPSNAHSALSDPLISTDSSSVQHKFEPSGSSTESFFVFGKRRQSSVHAVTSACVRFTGNCKEGAAAFCQWLASLRTMKWHIQFVKLEVMFTRAWRVLLRRDKLIVGSTLVVVYFAVMFGAMLGKSTNDAIAVASMFGMGNLVIILSNLPLIFYLYHNHQVFLREHSRGLYSSLSHWFVSDNPIMILRVLQGMCYGFIIHEWLQLREGDAMTYYYVCTIIMFILSTQLVETIVYILPNIRSAYHIVPAVGFLLFYFSGITVRPDLLPGWLAPWLPSVSMIRWLTQGLLINEYQYNEEAFPVLEPNNFSTYNYALSLFGWGGKTKWYCLYMLLLNLGVYRVLYLLVSIFHTTAQKGRRSQLLRQTPKAS